MTGEMSPRICYTKLNLDFPYVRSLSLRRDTYSIVIYIIIVNVIVMETKQNLHTCRHHMTTDNDINSKYFKCHL